MLTKRKRNRWVRWGICCGELDRSVWEGAVGSEIFPDLNAKVIPVRSKSK